MDQYNSIDHDFHNTPNEYPNLSANISNDQQFRLNKINEIKDYFLAEIREKELTSENTSKYIASVDYFDKSLNVLSRLAGSISVAPFATVTEAPPGIIGASCVLTFWITSGFIKNFFRTTRNNHKNNKIVILS